ncbi:type ISP restriction/modification enzyme [Dysgonomonas sp. Marseille-Q5470]|uniref:DEAD/DEAH box helicase n=1 Tax=Dysgonomonas sp. Marseille-Q5470 TaxID=3039494 RepID=UPI0024BBF701|nr:type ISP restriction/modification enzyme [Dysgonomonas sp. Marseille-Q5470]
MSIETFKSVLDKFRKEALSERDKGFKFEKLIQYYLKTTSLYTNLFKEVWMWNEFPSRAEFGKNDVGIDLVALTHDDEFWAIQCKCYQANTYIDKKEVDSFLSTSGKYFTNPETSEQINFSNRLWVSTTNNWSDNAEKALHNQNPPVSRLSLTDLESDEVDWLKLEKGIFGDSARVEPKKPFDHQIEALKKSHEYLQTRDRGKLIMACGTGKTFTSLKLAEQETNNKGLVLFLVPSIALLGQTLREWSAQASEPINAICICSDAKVSQKVNQNDDETFSVVNLALPASTDVHSICKQLQHSLAKNGMTVVFSTYQSIDVISQAQQYYLNNFIKEGEVFENEAENTKGIFDLIICDEAHRTTGVTISGHDESAFVKVHDNNFIKARKRIYMTATPRLYSDETKTKADQNDAILCSMDDEAIYGPEIYRIGFGEAVDRNLLSDYKVLVLTVGDKDISPSLQRIISGEDGIINADDASKMVGCINALSKKMLGDAAIIKDTDPDPMRKAVAFCQNIKVSKATTQIFNECEPAYFEDKTEEEKASMVYVQSKHIDGSMSAPQRDELLSWLKSNPEDDKECRMLTNVRCLSEGVDVPSLDAVLFLSARNSQVDVVQSVGRVMRKAEGKKYGYIIIPVVVPEGVDASEALDRNPRFNVVWTVLNALRAHDDRFNATVNKIELNKNKPAQILIGGIDNGKGEGGEGAEGTDPNGSSALAAQLAFQFEELQSTFYAKMVQKVGNKRYWEQWAKDIAHIAEEHIIRIQNLIKEEGKHKKAFDEFIKGLRKNINPSVSEQEAIEMLSQHMITKPVFEALFENYSFVQNNPISQSMQKVMELLDDEITDDENDKLQKFYDSVRRRVEGIDNAEGKQKVIVELYDKFFKSAFPKVVEKLGIVYTPVEVVDFIVHSVGYILKKEFDRSISDENVHILDPFTGTGTFIARLLQSGLISKEDLERKYTKELHANEIVLLAYYIASINIENIYHDLSNDGDSYRAFDGICLTDTFQLGEDEHHDRTDSDVFPQNSKRVKEQKKTPLRVIIGNPPYSKGQKSANDNAQNQKYEILDSRIEQTYVKETDATNKNAIYDSYIKAFRWASDRLDKKNGGVIAFVSNSGWLDGSGMDGFRKCIEREFTSIYVFNLRGNQRTTGELSRKEGGKIFGSGSRTPIAITLLVKNPQLSNNKATIHYHDIGDYLSREEKLSKIKDFKSIDAPSMQWGIIHPNEHGDWISLRNDIFKTFLPIESLKKFDTKTKSFYTTYSLGIATARDAWVYNFSKEEVENNMKNCINFYNEIREEYTISKDEKSIEYDSKKISWNDSLKDACKKNKLIEYSKDVIIESLYRPYCKTNLYFERNFIQRPYQQTKLFPTPLHNNLIICVSGLGGTKSNTAIITNCIPDLNTLDAGTQCFPLYWYEENAQDLLDLFKDTTTDRYIRRDGVSDFILKEARVKYGHKTTKEDIFYYVYGILHSPDYRTAFEADLKKMLPRLPLVDKLDDFWAFSKAGRELAHLHLNYETVEPYKGVIPVFGAGNRVDYRVEKMRFGKKDKETDKSTIYYNRQIRIDGIPLEAYDYVVNGKSAIEWIMERYAVTINKDSQIKNDPNDWAREHDDEKYIYNLLLRVITVSVETVKIVNGLPKLEF